MIPKNTINAKHLQKFMTLSHINPKTQGSARAAQALPESGDEGWQEHVASNHSRKPAALDHGQTCLGSAERRAEIRSTLGWPWSRND